MLPALDVGESSTRAVIVLLVDQSPVRLLNPLHAAARSAMWDPEWWVFCGLEVWTANLNEYTAMALAHRFLESLPESTFQH